MDRKKIFWSKAMSQNTISNASTPLIDSRFDYSCSEECNNYFLCNKRGCGQITGFVAAKTYAFSAISLVFGAVADPAVCSPDDDFSFSYFGKCMGIVGMAFSTILLVNGCFKKYVCKTKVESDTDLAQKKHSRCINDAVIASSAISLTIGGVGTLLNFFYSKC